MPFLFSNTMMKLLEPPGRSNPDITGRKKAGTLPRCFRVPDEIEPVHGIAVVVVEDVETVSLEFEVTSAYLEVLSHTDIQAFIDPSVPNASLFQQHRG